MSELVWTRARRGAARPPGVGGCVAPCGRAGGYYTRLYTLSSIVHLSPSRCSGEPGDLPAFKSSSSAGIDARGFATVPSHAGVVQLILATALPQCSRVLSGRSAWHPVEHTRAGVRQLRCGACHDLMRVSCRALSNLGHVFSWCPVLKASVNLQQSIAGRNSSGRAGTEGKSSVCVHVHALTGLLLCLPLVVGTDRAGSTWGG
jgi:hypothetical protein